MLRGFDGDNLGIEKTLDFLVIPEVFGADQNPFERLFARKVFFRERGRS